MYFIFIMILSATTLLLALFIVKKIQHINQLLESQSKIDLPAQINQLKQELSKETHDNQLKLLHQLQESQLLQNRDLRDQIAKTMQQHAELLSQQVKHLTQETNQRLREINGQVEKRLSEGFEKTTATFTDIVKRLAIIDQAQKKITELSSNVVSLQEVLSDKKSRGAFGEVQLNSLIRNMIPEQHFSLQHSLSNGKRVDCMLFLPEPTGNVAIDAKFPLEIYQQLQTELPDSDKRKAESQFRTVIKKHIQDIASKYILPGETSDGAMMFIPAEAIFAEIHANYAELVDYAHQQRVWLVSPTTLMAILTTARAVLKDAATRKQIHIIQEHLSRLAIDFQRFEKRMDNLNRHIHQAQQDVVDVHTSAKKITSRFNKIEQVEIDAEPPAIAETEEA